MKEKVIVLIDGENFRKSIKTLLESEKRSYFKYDYSKIKLRNLIEGVLSSHKNLNISEIRYYGARLKSYGDNDTESKQKIAEQRSLISNLTNQGIKFLFKGNVRRRELPEENGEIKYTFVEKGVDVGMAVDMVSIAYDKKASKVVLCSSDSDLQSAVRETLKRGTKIVYLGFSINPNKGLQATTSESVLFRNQELIDAIPHKTYKKKKRSKK